MKSWCREARYQSLEHPAFPGWIVWDTLYNRLMAQWNTKEEAQSYANILNG